MMLLPWRAVLLAAGPVPAISSSVTEPETQELRRLASQGGVQRILEVGSAFGYSAIAMALANRDAHVDAVDPHTELGSHPVAGGSEQVMAGNLRAYGVDHQVTMVVEPSQEALPKLELGSYDLAFIDADHTEAAVHHDVTWALKLLKPGGWLCCHDLDEGTCPGVRAALDRLFEHPQPTVDTLFTYQT